MTDRPILFSGPMVRAILDGSKTQTRRVVTKATAHNGSGRWDWSDLDAAWVDRGFGDCQYLHAPRTEGEHDNSEIDRIYPRIMNGDTLWVRETFALDPSMAELERERDAKKSGDWERVFFKADLAELPRFQRWRPSIHMPRWASRLSLKVTDVRAQRVQDIGNRDVLEEGLLHTTHYDGILRAGFEGLWDSINAKRGYPWKANPWVFAYTFEVTP